jgi:hypothetical protein
MTLDTNPEIHVNELNGFLNGIRCSIGIPTRQFGAVLIPNEGMDFRGISERVVKSNSEIVKVVSKKFASFEEVKEVFESQIYKKHENLDDDSLTNLDWNLVEYYGLIATSENPEGKWNPVVSEKSYLFEVEMSDHQMQKLIFVEYEKFVVLTWL